jgi:hypothetical protein
MKGVCGANEAFLFHYWNLGLGERIREESRCCDAGLRGVGYFEFRRPQNAGKVVLAVRPNVVKLFSTLNGKFDRCDANCVRGSFYAAAQTRPTI